MRELPMLVKADRGDHKGLLQIVLRDDQSWEQAQEYAQQFASGHGMKIIRKVDGPDAWLWYVEYEGSTLVIGYDDYPCETVIFVKTKNDETALKGLFGKISRKEA